MTERARILIAGIGGASLGTEVLKSLHLADRYTVFGCDISPLACGHYLPGFQETFVVDRNRYVEGVLEVCRKAHVGCIVPGGEEPALLMGRSIADFEKEGIKVVSNSPEVVAVCSNKRNTFERLNQLGLPAPWTMSFERATEIRDIPCPCVVKPATGTGGSSFVFLATTLEECALYVRYLVENGRIALVQEYIPHEEGEFTIGVLATPDGRLLGSIAMRRLFHAKLSVLLQSDKGIISSGYSQGLIDEFTDVRAQAERIALALGSVGPMNIQGRLHKGVLIPFEINARLSASTYLRAMAGFNEVDMLLRYILDDAAPQRAEVRAGYYLRTLSEVYVRKDQIKQ